MLKIFSPTKLRKIFLAFWAKNTTDAAETVIITFVFKKIANVVAPKSGKNRKKL
jgi:hypothetical protein